METNEPEILSEQILRDYHIVTRLGHGGMGDVYLAEQMRVGRRLVALKVLNRSCASNPQVIKRFEAEAATAGLIHHRNVVTIYESRMTEDGQIYVAMEYVDGKTLREVLKEQGRLPLELVVEIVKQVCAGLAAAHKLGVVHRDIKPDNIMLVHDDEGLTIKLLDFGIARLSETQSEMIHTRPGLILGTPAYMSPEQAAGSIGDQIDSRSDIYSLGIVVYEMLTGHIVFNDVSWVDVLHKHLYELPPPPSQICSKEFIPSSIDQALMRALAKDRNKRPQTALEFAREMEDAYLRSTSDQEQTAVRFTKPLHDFSTRTGNDPSLVQPSVASSQGSQTTPDFQAEQKAAQVKRQSYKNLVKVAILLIALTGCVLVGAMVWSKIIKNREAGKPAAEPEAAVKPIQKKDLLEYRVKREKPVENLITLPLDHTVRSGESIFFEFKLAQPGAIYLMEEMIDKSWRWFDATGKGEAPLKPAGVWEDVPHGRFYVLDNDLGVEKFWLIYVPDKLHWTLAEAIAPSRIELSKEKVSKGTGVIDPVTVDRLVSQLAADGVRLEAEGSKNGDAIEFRLRQPGDDLRVAYYQIALNHVARE